MSSWLLLDTHVLLWALLDPARIPASTLDVLRDPTTELLVSAATAWEIGTKFRLGRLAGAQALVHSYPEQLDRFGARELAITSRHSLTAGLIEWDHRDPFDRMIAAQCLLESVVLVTADRALTAFPGGLRVLW